MVRIKVSTLSKQLIEVERRLNCNAEKASEAGLTDAANVLRDEANAMRRTADRLWAYADLIEG